MCEPMSIAMGAMAIGSAAMQHQQASMQAKAQSRMYEINQASAISALGENYATTGIRANQETQAASDAIWERNRQALMERSSATAAAGEAGVSGISVDRIMGDIMGAAGRDNATTQQNLKMTHQQLGRENLSHRSAALNRINSTQRGTPPSKWATAFNIGTAATNAYTNYSTRTGNTPVEDWWANRGQGRDAAL